MKYDPKVTFFVMESFFLIFLSENLLILFRPLLMYNFCPCLILPKGYKHELELELGNTKTIRSYKRVGPRCLDYLVHSSIEMSK